MPENTLKRDHNHVYDLLMQDDEITWQSILLDLVKTEQMNPWDVDISLLSQKYLERVKKMEELNFFVSGKIILASAILLKLKSNKFLLENISDFDNLLYPPEDNGTGDDELYLNAPDVPEYLKGKDIRLTIKTPQPRKRKVSVSDLVDALKKALEVEQRKVQRVLDRNTIPENLEVPETKIEISSLIKDVYGKIKIYFEKNKSDLTFTQLVASPKKEDKITTFIPLLHLSNQERVDLRQLAHFEEIYIRILDNGTKTEF